MDRLASMKQFHKDHAVEALADVQQALNSLPSRRELINENIARNQSIVEEASSFLLGMKAIQRTYHPDRIIDHNIEEAENLKSHAEHMILESRGRLDGIAQEEEALKQELEALKRFIE